MHGEGLLPLAAILGLVQPGGNLLARTAGRISGQLAQVGVGGLASLDADPAIDGPGAIRTGDDRTEFQLGDLREIVGELGDP